MIQDKQLLEKFYALPDEEQSAVIDFIEKLQNKKKHKQINVENDLENDPILKVAGTLSITSVTNKEIDEELYE